MGEEGQNKFLVAYIVPEGLYIVVETIKLTSAYECFNLYKVLKWNKYFNIFQQITPANLTQMWHTVAEQGVLPPGAKYIWEPLLVY